MLLKYAAKTKAMPNHLNFPLFDWQDENYYEATPTRTRPAAIRARELSQIANLELSCSFSVVPSEYPPWQLQRPIINYDLAQFNKETTSPILIQTNFLASINTYHEFQIIYTDGSKTSRGTGSAFFTTGQTFSWKLPSIGSVFTAELYAIWQALRYCDLSPQTRFLICSDSMSALQSLDSLSNDALIQAILMVLHWLLECQKHIRFLWIPSHAGITGNEKADYAARSAANLDGDPDVELPRLEDIYLLAKSITLESWQREWSRYEGHLRRIKRDIGVWKLPINLNRRDQVVLTRLRIGHTNLTSSHLLVGERRPYCNICDVELTVAHLLISCEHLRGLRVAMGIGENLDVTLSNDLRAITKIIQFVKRAGIYKRI